MQFTNLSQSLVLLAAMTTCTSTLKLTADTPDGVYTVDPKAGTLVALADHIAAAKAEDTIHTAGTKSAKLRKRDDYTTKCEDNGNVLDSDDVSRAADNLGATCDTSTSNWVPDGVPVLSKYGDIVYYMCAWYETSWCTKAGIKRDQALVAGKCKGVSGYVYHDLELPYTYGFTNLDQNLKVICGWAY